MQVLAYAAQTDILLNGIYWEESVPRLFQKEDITNNRFIIQTIADISDDKYGSIPINISNGNIENPVYGIDRNSFEETRPYETNSVDVMAVGNLPNELPRDASRYFGEQLIKYVLDNLSEQNNNNLIKRATIAAKGNLGSHFQYLQNYVE
ncbi:Rossmann-fold NAD(P)-binding domain-containing protein [Niabella ginsengisoli]|uniref:Alanine dehydrogenase/pyridine nucleotide transhydrogenase NAD(H)-binding domain-containing protein n=1 Tax=Niabella ginsengisoli TaxID=522298 RepID=A0ABS9SF71_9BACT|nr:hypothetical protein [Niabella ginsengisoli]MCH5597008.1 hypothetical protein [Niabella ginsengisoli]